VEEGWKLANEAEARGGTEEWRIISLVSAPMRLMICARSNCHT